MTTTMQMLIRNELADELLADTVAPFRVEHEHIGDLLRDVAVSDELVLDACEAVPETYSWLRGEFATNTYRSMT
jgi:hypothetical protein